MPLTIPVTTTPGSVDVTTSSSSTCGPVRWLTVADLVAAAAPGAQVAADVMASIPPSANTPHEAVRDGVRGAVRGGVVDVRVQGVSLPGAATLSWVYSTMRHPDLALYVTMAYAN